MPAAFRAPATVALLLLISWFPAPVHCAEAPATPAAAAPATAPTPADIGSWLVLGPLAAPLPALAADDPQHPVGIAEQLARPPLAPAALWPTGGERLTLADGTQATWTATAVGDGRLTLPGGGEPSWTVAVAYLRTDAFQKVRLEIAATPAFSAWVDGQKVCERANADSLAAPVGAELKLTQGQHALAVFTLADPAAPGARSLRGMLTPIAPTGAAAPRTTTQAERPIRIRDYLDTQAISGIQLSADGQLLATTWRRPEVPAPDSETWIEIRRTADGAPVRTIRGEHAGSFTWATVGQRFSYVTQREDRSTLWVDDLAGGTPRAVLRDIDDLGGHRWLPGGRAIVYTLSEERGHDPEGFKRLRGLTDRWGGARDVGSLHLVTVADGMTRRLTAGRWTCDVQDLAPDGRRLLMTRSVRDDATFPFNTDELYELDVVTLAATKLLAVPRGVAARYGDQDGVLFLRAGPSAFDGVGRDLPDDRLPNDYDDQLFRFDRTSGRVEPLTRDFAPSIGDFFWSPRAGRLIATATDTTAVGLFAWSGGGRGWASLPSGVEVVGGLALSDDGTRLAWYGEDAMAPERIYALDLTRKGARPVLVAAPAAAALSHVRLGHRETWNFTSAGGTRILGDVYYPPDYSPEMSRSWPCIVFYYGGTSPVSHDYGGRYPLNLWAAHGYIVYVLQPSGATGFGQEFSSRHVNDWGQTTADEVIEGTRKFLAAHPFVDRAKVGCIGASYGGFLTMSLLTKTDLFAAAVSHAGISTLSSYWGEGWWGVDYSSVATAGSYPWNRPDLYVEQSPLFHADRITTPLLLLHGTADTNVPVGESEQMYAALRVLGKPVEFVRVEGQNHWIVNYPQRVVWMETIIAWFDRQLKDQPAWWNDLWSDGTTDAGSAR